jgi:imidazole glycerol-phosphate synthase subunit HisH
MSRSPVIGLVDYGSGNLRSVQKALEVCGASVISVRSAADVGDQDALVMPGVGSFGDAAMNLHSTGLWEIVGDWLRDGRPYLGICLGYQLLFEGSEESPEEAGLGIFSGRVVRFPASVRKIPHMGWNSLKEARGPLFAEAPRPWVYFVHSFYPAPTDAAVVSSYCEYEGLRFAASVTRGAIHATQFHPEKSQEAGLAVLRGFLGSLSI